MKKYLTLLIALAVLPHASLAEDSRRDDHAPAHCIVVSEQATTQDTRQTDLMQLARSGCCSWHRGVCGCQAGRVVCCDGTLSPSCTCHRDDPPQITN